MSYGEHYERRINDKRKETSDADGSTRMTHHYVGRFPPKFSGNPFSFVVNIERIRHECVTFDLGNEMRKNLLKISNA